MILPKWPVIAALLVLAGCQSVNYVGSGPIVLRGVHQASFDQYKNTDTSDKYFLMTTDAKGSFRFYCEDISGCQMSPGQAVNLCEMRYGKPCKIYAEGNEIVWRFDGPKTVPEAPFWAKTAATVDTNIARLKSSVVKSCPRCYLRGANLEGADLRGATLEGANLERANLRRTYLQRANIFGTYLNNADLEGANLFGANLDNAKLHDANLTNANLEDASLKEANLTNANLEGANLKNADLQGANLQDARLDNAGLKVARSSGAKNVPDTAVANEKSPLKATRKPATSDIETRLRKLQRLERKGLITKEDAARTRKELLEKL